MTRDKILKIIYKNSCSGPDGFHISFKQLEHITELLLIEKMRSRVQLAYDYMSQKGITFGSSEGDEMAVNMFIAGMEAQENKTK